VDRLNPMNACPHLVPARVLIQNFYGIPRANYLGAAAKEGRMLDRHQKFFAGAEMIASLGRLWLSSWRAIRLQRHEDHGKLRTAQNAVIPSFVRRFLESATICQFA